MKKIFSFLCLIVAVTAMTSCSSAKEEKGTSGTGNAVLDNIFERKSVRAYLNKGVEKEKIDLMLRAGMAAPTGRDIRPWEFVVVQEKETLEKLSHCRVGAAKMLENAGCAILVFANPEKTDVWVEDCSIVMSNMHLMADSLGLGSCWIQGRLREAENGESTEAYCRKLLNVPEEYVLEAILSVGILKEHPNAHTLEELEKEKVHYETY